MDRLVCEICDYESKQLHQHLKSVHNMSSTEYRKLYGEDKQMQIGFFPKRSVNKFQSEYIKKGYKKEKELLNSITDLYSKKDVYEILLKDNYYTNFIGKTKNRTLFKKNLKLYKSLYLYTDELLKYFRTLTLPTRLKFVIECNYDIEKLKCSCGRTYTLNTYCRRCPEPRNTWQGKKHTKETKKKQRISTIRYLNKTKGQLSPRYNINSISIIEKIGKNHSYNFQHAENGGEYYIDDLGYFLDAYDSDKNVVLEIDEKHHYDINGNLKEKDVIRQQNITEYFNNIGHKNTCKFIRFRYKERYE